eukprot:TRINITY_DN15368_c0_g1_i2.p1 TRINITY_DN15368_c0_g1~~TRINITY_DN15368_c0_g1_i2.p1  ORF type:complete len:237 (-),score=55.75 TRINITY_DN15368_c0_g1_i2:283-993(-)
MCIRDRCDTHQYYHDGVNKASHVMLGFGITESALLVINAVLLAWINCRPPLSRPRRLHAMACGLASACLGWAFLLSGLAVYTADARRNLEHPKFGASLGIAWGLCGCLLFASAAWAVLFRRALADSREQCGESKHQPIPESDLELGAPAMVCLAVAPSEMALKLGECVPRIPTSTVQAVLFNQGYVSFKDLLNAEGGIDGAELLRLFEDSLEVKPPELRRIKELLRENQKIDEQAA